MCPQMVAVQPQHTLICSLFVWLPIMEGDRSCQSLKMYFDLEA